MAYSRRGSRNIRSNKIPLIMQKPKTKKWARRIIMTILLSLVVTFAAPALTTFAADPECPDNFTVHEGTKCLAPDEATTCPTGYTTDEEGFEGKAVCTKTPTPQETVDESARAMASNLVKVQNFLNRLIWPVLVMTGGLLDNGLLFGSGMEERLREIWIPIRNIVNILFVITLVGIALYNVLGIGEDEGTYSIKSMLPKIIIGIIAVNFSFLGIKIFLDAINVLTVSIFSLPTQISEEIATVVDVDKDTKTVNNFCKLVQGKSIGEGISEEDLIKEAEEIIYRNLASKYGVAISETDSVEQIKQKVQQDPRLKEDAKEQFERDAQTRREGQICQGFSLTPQGTLFLDSWGHQNAALAMALDMSKIVFYQEIEPNVDNIEKLVINTLFSVLLYILYIASFLALFIVLLARLVVLWLAIALSPALLLGMVIPFFKEKVQAFGTVTDHFVKNAIAPISIALAMTVGWIMLRALQSVNAFERGSSLSFGNGIPVTGLSTIQDLVVAVGTIAVVWLAVFAAAGESIAAPVTKFMKEWLGKGARYFGTLPIRHIPLVPIKLPGEAEGERYTLSQVIAGAEEAMIDRDKYKLAEKFRSRRPPITEIAAATTGKEVADLLRTNESKVKAADSETVRSLRRFKESNRDAYNAMRAAGGWQEKMANEIDIITDSASTPEQIKDASGRLAELARKNGEVLPERSLLEGPRRKAAGPAAAAAGAAAAAAGEGGGTPITGETIWGGDGVALEAQNVDDNTITGLNTAINNLRTAITNKDTAQIETTIGQFGANMPTRAQLRTALGNTAYTQLERQVGGRERLETLLRPAEGGGTPPEGGGAAEPPAEGGEEPPTAGA